MSHSSFKVGSPLNFFHFSGFSLIVCELSSHVCSVFLALWRERKDVGAGAHQRDVGLYDISLALH